MKGKKPKSYWTLAKLCHDTSEMWLQLLPAILLGKKIPPKYKLQLSPDEINYVKTFFASDEVFDSEIQNCLKYVINSQQIQKA